MFKGALTMRYLLLTTVAGKKAKVTFEYEADDEDELTLHVGDLIDVIYEVEDGWWYGNLNGTTGHLPSNFVELVDEKDVGQGKDKPQVAQALWLLSTWHCIMALL